MRDANPINFNIILECVDDFIQVDDEEIANAVLFLLEKHKIIVEGAGAASVATLLHQKINTQNHKKNWRSFKRRQYRCTNAKYHHRKRFI